MCPDERKNLWSLCRAERYFLALIMCISAGPAGSDATSSHPTLKQPAAQVRIHKER